MTTTATGRKLTSACNGVTKAFNCPIFQLPADLSVYLLNALTDANSAGTLLVQGVDYVITGDGPSGTAQVTTTIAYPNGKYLRRWRKTSRAQGVDFVTNQGVPAATQEGGLDRLSLIDEELDDDIADVRSAVVPLIATSSIMGNAALVPAVAVPLTGQQVAGLLPAFTGDAGGVAGVKGLVPAPPIGAAAGNKFLGADGTWKVVPATAVPAFIGDTGAGGVAGLVPAPAAGDAAAGRYLKADGSWGLPAGGGGGGGVTSSLLTFNNGGAGAASGSTFDGSVARTISWNSIGAAPINSPALTGAPTAPTPAPGDNSTKLATSAFVAAALAALVNSSPAALDTLKELADALGDDANFAATMTTALAGKAAARPTIAAVNASINSVDGDNNLHLVLSGAGTPTLTLVNNTAGTSFTVRATTAWAIACAGGLSKNGAAPGGVTVGAIAANSLITFLHEGAGVWIASGSGLT